MTAMRIIIEKPEDKEIIHQLFRNIVNMPDIVDVSRKKNGRFIAEKPVPVVAPAPPGFSYTAQDGEKWSWNKICAYLRVCSATLGKMRKATGEKYLICHRLGPRSTVCTSEEKLILMHDECRKLLKKRGERGKAEKS